jgi:hypothetical protein
MKLALRAQRKLQAMPAANKTLSSKLLKSPPKFCPFNNDLSCDSSSKYRQIDGSCNNLANGIIGRSNTPYKRLMKAQYQDKVEEPRRMGASGEPLPNPRSISLAIHDPMDTPAAISNLGVMFGQFVDHDFAQTATTGAGSVPLKCTCGSTSADCINIATPPDDTVDDQDCGIYRN